MVAAEAGGLDPGGRFALAALQFKGNVTDPFVQAAFAQLRTKAGDRFAEHDLQDGLHRRRRVGGGQRRRPTKDTGGPRQACCCSARSSLLSLLFFRGPCWPPSPAPCRSSSSAAQPPGWSSWPRSLSSASKLDVEHALVAHHGRARRGRHRLLPVPPVPGARAPARGGGPGGPPRSNAAVFASARSSSSAALVVVAAFATLRRRAVRAVPGARPGRSPSRWLVMLAGGRDAHAGPSRAVTGRALFWPSKRSVMHERTRTAPRHAWVGTWIARRPGPDRALRWTMCPRRAVPPRAVGAKMNYDLTSSGPSWTPASSRTVRSRSPRSLPRGRHRPAVWSTSALDGARDPQRRGARANASQPSASGRYGVGQRVGPPSSHVTATGVAHRSRARRRLHEQGAGWTRARGPLRDAAHGTAPAGSTAMGGRQRVAVFADVSDSIAHDLKLIFPLAAGLIVADPRAVRSAASSLPLYLLGRRGRSSSPRRSERRCSCSRRSAVRAGHRVHAPARPVPVRRRAGHGLQHPHDRAAARGDAGRRDGAREAVAEAVRHVAPVDRRRRAGSWRRRSGRSPC